MMSYVEARQYTSSVDMLASAKAVRDRILGKRVPEPTIKRDGLRAAFIDENATTNARSHHGLTKQALQRNKERLREAKQREYEAAKETARATRSRVKNAVKALEYKTIVVIPMANEFRDLDAATTPVDYIKIRARQLGFSHDEIIGTGRYHPLTEARRAMMAEVYLKYRKLSLPQIGKLFCKDHTSVYAALLRSGVYGKRGEVA